MYNTEPYIRRCLRSLQDQTYRNWEAIVVNDGSTDRSLDICREIAAADPRVRVISQDNGGVSSARNRGLDAAQGAFLFFLDSDDAIHPLLLEEMILQAHRTNADFLACGLMYLEPDQVEPVLRTASVHEQRPVWETPSADEVGSLMFDYPKFMSGIGGKMIRRSAVRGEEPLHFREDLFLGEDTYFLNQLFHRPIRVAFTSQEWYYYIQNPVSLSHTLALTEDPRYYVLYYLLQEHDLKAGDEDGARRWEREMCRRFIKNFLLQREAKNTKGKAAVRALAAAECQRPFFRGQPRRERWHFQLFCFHYPLYKIYRFLSICWFWVRKGFWRLWGGFWRRWDALRERMRGNDT